ncbi:hypothetical protein [Brevibacillus sp. NRS-1366]|uniref:hypothetical protein n=1 Tax=Brevibacillus sp. NRS-1366 TaxID=3233899 RepID=UPI003D2060DC
MNRVFLLVFGLLLGISVIHFLVKRKTMPPKQQSIIFILYTLTIALLVCLQYQYNELLPFRHLASFFSPLKRWIEQMM